MEVGKSRFNSFCITGFLCLAGHLCLGPQKDLVDRKTAQNKRLEPQNPGMAAT